MSKHTPGPWKFLKGQRRLRLPHTIVTASDGAFIAEVDEVGVGKAIVEAVAALAQTRDALQSHTTVDGPEFRAWERANAVLKTIEQWSVTADAVAITKAGAK